LSLNATHPETRPRVVIAERYSASAIDRLRSVAEVVDLVGAERGALLGALHNADALLVRSYVAVDDELLAHAPRLKVVARGGVGLDNIDVARAHSRGIGRRTYPSRFDPRRSRAYAGTAVGRRASFGGIAMRMCGRIASMSAGGKRASANWAI
jgi:hypothetical protein